MCDEHVLVIDGCVYIQWCEGTLILKGATHNSAHGVPVCLFFPFFLFIYRVSILFQNPHVGVW